MSENENEEERLLLHATADEMNALHNEEANWDSDSAPEGEHFEDAQEAAQPVNPFTVNRVEQLNEVLRRADLNGGEADNNADARNARDDNAAERNANVEYVNAFEESSFEPESEEGPSTSNAGYDMPEKIRKIKKAEEDKKRQDAFQKQLMTGTSPGKWAEAFNSFGLVKDALRKDLAVETFVKNVTNIARQLERINKAYLKEFHPERQNGLNAAFELGMNMAARDLLQQMTLLPPNTEASRWRIEVYLHRSPTNPFQRGIYLKLWFTARSFASAAAHFEELGTNFSVQFVVDRFTSQIDLVLEKSGLRGLKPMRIPKELIEHARWGPFVKDLIHPWKRARGLIKDLKNSVTSLADKSLEDLAKITEEESFALSLVELWGNECVRDNNVVVLTPTGSLKCFEICPKSKHVKESSLPAWAKEVYITMHKAAMKSQPSRHQSGKRHRGNDRPDRQDRNHNYQRGNKRRRFNN